MAMMIALTLHAHAILHRVTGLPNTPAALYKKPPGAGEVTHFLLGKYWANYYWAITTRFKWFNRRFFDEFLEAQDDHKHRLKHPQTPIFFAGLVPKMCPKKVA